MKVLTQTEVQTVSGAGKIADSLGTVGGTLGTALNFFGMKNAVANATALGTSIGLVVESVYGAITASYKFFFDKA
ncbi:hypothetical protein HA49_02390 [Tatumella morbirosei]|uniref:Bacteriocin n=1 Tax=Tatumella morbirosei TaxID=642227 RepID=A0A095TRG0_9GAMM|nr:hypothetical protein [Tatumella morbirosei]KGD79451.1 hypothetical protein HA49_02390 [Tatumella morbirosei]